MKKGLTVLGAAVVCSTLFACNPDNKVTKITIDALPYALTHKWYDINLNVEGKGSFRKDVTWTTNDPHAYVTSDCKFQYMSSMPSNDPVDVVITATSIQDSSVSASFTIKVLANSITEDDFLENAKSGDDYRLKVIQEAQKEKTGTTKVDIASKFGTNDFIQEFKGRTDLKEVKYTVRSSTDPAESEETTLSIATESAEHYKVVPSSETLKTRFADFKESGQNYSCFDTGNEQGIVYGYVTAVKDSSGVYYTEVNMYQYGLPITYWYYQGETLIDNINLEPDFI